MEMSTSNMWIDVGSRVPPAQEIINLFSFGFRLRTLEPIDDVIVENFVVEMIIFENPGCTIRQCETKL